MSCRHLLKSAVAGLLASVFAMLGAALPASAQADKWPDRPVKVIVPIQTPEQMTAYPKEDIRRNLAVIKATNIKVD